MGTRPILLLLEGTYPWYRGGVSEWVHQYVEHCPEYTFHILQIATDEYRNAPIDVALYDMPEQVRQFERISPPELSGVWNDDLARWFGRIDLLLQSMAEKCELIHVTNTGFAGWLGSKSREQFNRPLILTEHALYWKEIAMGAVALECGYKVPESPSGKQAFKEMFRSIASEVYRDADAVVSVSKCNIPQQKALGARRVQYIPNGIPKSWLKVSAKERSGTLTIGWIGRCAEMKNPMKFLDLIDAFRRAGYPDVQFLMLTCDAGEPELKERLKGRAIQYPELTVHWNKAAEGYIDRMDALCISSHNESQPLVLFEALSRKVLPVGWQAGDADEKFGLILDSNASAEDLAAAITKHWAYPKVWKQEVDSRFLDIRQQHTWEHIFGDYKILFNRILKNSATIG